MKNKINILLIGANINSYNRGVAALGLATIALVIKRYPKAKISILDLHNNNRKNTNTKINFIIINKIELIKYYIYSFLFKLNFNKLPTKFKLLLKQDIILDIGEGDSFSDIYEFKRIVAFSILKVIFYNLNKKIIMLPQTIGPFNTFIGKNLAKFSLKKVSTIYVREEISYKLARKITQKNIEIKQNSDLAFSLKPKILSSFKYKNFIGINISGLLYKNTERKKLLGINFDYPNLINQIVKYFLNKNSKVILIPHTYSINGKAGFDDLKASQEIKSKFNNPNLIVVSKSYSASELKYIIGESEYFIGSRMHACIAAVSQLIPTTPISYSYKFEGVFKKLGLGKTIGNPKIMSEKEILNLVIKNYKNRKKIIKNLSPKIEKAQNEIKEIFESI